MSGPRLTVRQWQAVFASLTVATLWAVAAIALVAFR